VGEFGIDLDVVQPLEFRGMDSDDWASYTMAIEGKTLGEVLGDPSLRDDLTAYLGGVLMKIDEISPPISPDDVAARIDLMRQDPLFARDTAGRDVDVIGLEFAPDGDGYTSVAIVVLDRDLNYFKTTDAAVVDERVAAREWELVRQALVRKTSLQQVSSFSASMAQTRSANAWAAIILSLLGILAYIWIRFGSLRFSAAAIVALLHDVILTLGALAVTGYLVGNTFFSQTMMIGEFRIDLGVVAALLTVIGYSLNDTIVILDRIRENRGRLPFPTKAIVNDSINQTISRTVLTSTTTLLAVAIIFTEGGLGIRPFAYCLFIGILVGTYSSVAIAAPMVYKRGGGIPIAVEEDDSDGEPQQ
jgi:SecD/SecF fusion protein